MGKRKHPGGFGGRGSRPGNDQSGSRESERWSNDRRPKHHRDERRDTHRSDKPRYGEARSAEKRPFDKHAPDKRSDGPRRPDTRPGQRSDNRPDNRSAERRFDDRGGIRIDRSAGPRRPDHRTEGRFSRSAPAANNDRPARPQPAPMAKPALKAETLGTWLYGHHAVLAALANPKRICHRLLVTEEAQTALNPRLAETLRERSPKIPTKVVERRDIEAILPHAVHQGIALDCAALPDGDLLDVIAALPERALLVVLDQVTDPHNVGAILRSAAAFGVAAVIVTERHAPHETGALAKAAAGALESVPVVRVINLARAMRDLKDANIWCLGLDGEATRSIDQTDSTGRVALVLGAEGTGLRRLTRETCDLLIRIPMAGAARHKGLDSLNVSNAAAVALYALSNKGSS